MTAMFAVTLDLSGIDYYLQRPDVFIVNLLYWVGWIPIAAVLIYGFFEVWLFNRQEHYRHKQKYVLLAVDVPKETEQSPKAMEHFFSAISGLWGGPNFKEKWIDGEVAPVISLELVSDGGYIQYYIRTPTKYRDIVEAALYSAYPDAEINEAEDYTQPFPSKFPDEHFNAWGCEQKLAGADYFPIRTYESFEHKLTQELKDPLALQLEQFAKIKPGEQVWTQYLIEPLGPLAKSWHKPGIKYIYEEIGKEDKNAHKSSIVKDVFGFAASLPLDALSELGRGLVGGEAGEGHDAKAEDPWKFLRSTPLDKARLDLVTQKINKPALHVKIRNVYIAPHGVYSKGPRDKMFKAIFTQYQYMDSNRFSRVDRVTPKTDYFWQTWFENTRKSNVVWAYKHRDVERGGHHFILNVEELATLWHFPTITFKTPFVSKTLAKRAEPPVQLPTELDGIPDHVSSAAAGTSAAPEALPVDFAEPTMPGQPKPTPSIEPHEPAPIGHHPSAEHATMLAEAAPTLPPKPAAEVKQTPVTKGGVPASVRALFDPGVEFNDASMADASEIDHEPTKGV